MVPMMDKQTTRHEIIDGCIHSFYPAPPQMHAFILPCTTSCIHSTLHHLSAFTTLGLLPFEQGALESRCAVKSCAVKSTPQHHLAVRASALEDMEKRKELGDSV